MAIRRIGQILVDLKFIDAKQLEAVLAEQKRRPDDLFGKIAIEMDLITEDQLAKALAVVNTSGFKP